MHKTLAVVQYSAVAVYESLVNFYFRAQLQLWLASLLPVTLIFAICWIIAGRWQLC
jgi:uncharacterized membrane protein YjdF